ncbi:MAG: ECF-type sigma factor [Myxococcota bacterium]
MESEPCSVQITQIIQSCGGDEAKLTAELFPVVYAELRRFGAQLMARLPPGQTLQPTALVHEAYVRLVAGASNDWKSRRHFFLAAARAMRFILIDQARRKSSAKRRPPDKREDLAEVGIEASLPTEDLLSVREALERLEAEDPRKAAIVDLRFFAGLSELETAEVLEVSRATVSREWRYIRYWLRNQLPRSKESRP